jgi:23S rRNA pseudouridine1911/1915/1917 synthase
MIIKITTKNIDNRLDKFLVAKLPDFSRSQIQKMIKGGEILVNGKIVAPHYFLKVGDKIELRSTADSPQPTAKKKKEINNKLSNNQPLIFNLKSSIVSETDDFLIIDKPAGLAVHPAPGLKEEKTLIDYILEKYPKIAKVGEDPGRPGIVHRLDKDVSGLIVIAKNQNSFDSLKQQFQMRKVKKEYEALVHGEVEKDEDTIDFPIGRGLKGRMAARAITAKEEGKRALTEFRVVKRYTNFTLLKVQIKTGRTHQIRVHLLAYGYPIVGDKIYFIKKIKPASLNRPFLHSSALGFYDLNNQWVEFKSDLPVELNDYLKNL